MNHTKIGKILKTHGIKGDLKVYFESSFDRFKKGNNIYILDDKENFIKYTILSSRVENNVAFIKLLGFDSINLVQDFIQKDIYIIQDKNKDLKKDEYYYKDLINKDIYENDILKGKVVDIMDNGIYEILVINKLDNKKGYIPFKKEFIKDVLDDRIDIYFLEGLL